MKLIFSYLTPYRGRLFAVGFLYLLATICSLFMPYVMRNIVDIGIRESDMPYILKQGAP